MSEDLGSSNAASDIPECDHLTAVPVQSKNISGHYDINLDGWLRIRSKYYWFEIETMGEDGKADIDDIPLDVTPRYLVYDIEDRHAKAAALRQTRRFRHLVGWHQCLLAKNDWKKGYFSSTKNPNWKTYFDEKRPVPGWREAKRLVGVSVDYNKTVCFYSGGTSGDIP